MADNPRIVVIGSYNRDIGMRVDRFPRPGETRMGDGYLESHGGKGSNQAVQAARCGAAVAIIAALGADAHGAAARALWRAEGIDAEAVATRAEAATGAALILVDAAGRNAITVAPGANATLSAEDVDRAAARIARAGLVLAQLETPPEATLRAFALARAAGAATLLNAAPAPPSGALPEALWELTDFLVVNEIEGGALAGCGAGASPEDVAVALVARLGRAAILTLGRRGALMAARGAAPLARPALDVAAVDTTGAGDAFAGAFAARWAATRNAESALAWGVAAGSLACLRRGVVPALHRGEEIARRLAEV
ncbi:MAG TPA: PfkB family carbohydrate kinase [Stellaceae bacterium]|nr:PfkB family carbohydrate kinase [Stellaceae bacterium]